MLLLLLLLLCDKFSPCSCLSTSQVRQRKRLILIYIPPRGCEAPFYSCILCAFQRRATDPILLVDLVWALRQGTASVPSKWIIRLCSFPLHAAAHRGRGLSDAWFIFNGSLQFSRVRCCDFGLCGSVRGHHSFIVDSIDLLDQLCTDKESTPTCTICLFLIYCFSKTIFIQINALRSASCLSPIPANLLLLHSAHSVDFDR